MYSKQHMWKFPELRMYIFKATQSEQTGTVSPPTNFFFKRPNNENFTEGNIMNEGVMEKV